MKLLFLFISIPPMSQPENIKKDIKSMETDSANTTEATDAFYLQRLESISNSLKQGKNVYPHKFHVKNTIKEIKSKYSTCQSNSKSEEEVSMAGRVVATRNIGRVNFYKILDDGEIIQIVIIANNAEDGKTNLKEMVKNIKRGDIVGFTGYPGKTKTDELSIFVDDIIILSPCLRTLPVEHFGLKDTELIYRRRYLDLILNMESRNRFITRSKVINYLRDFLIQREFIEVETPILNNIPGGAAAKPFVTFHNELKSNFYLRVSPELYHKKLIVGGLNRVFEIGKQFRNEGIDLTHNPEFTSCEFYMAYADYNDLMEMTEDLLVGMVKEVKGEEKICYEIEKNGIKETTEISFKKPFRRIDFLEEIKNKTGLNLTGESLEKNETLQSIVKYCNENNIELEEPINMTRALDKLASEYIEPECIHPTFLINHPVVMSPLAKTHRKNKYLTERFELFINKKEIINAYTELNNPVDQRERFDQQVKDKDAGDDEAMMFDEGFCMALEYALPPTGGWGIGIDRLVMYLTNAANIKDVLYFPAMKSDN
ncbi:Lysyl-tRNA synthetase [Spraguea lophii 42_110]|uniref:Lysine--tRNA ligase n=1 Tax=Spraguea lophii (strain 42_110) TaxID=1358809 RepID=S7W581_SPRLO|nr:Lysyl-tRNA synthetase [Spraguea lophii 42_110]